MDAAPVTPARWPRRDRRTSRSRVAKGARYFLRPQLVIGCEHGRPTLQLLSDGRARSHVVPLTACNCQPQQALQLPRIEAVLVAQKPLHEQRLYERFADAVEARGVRVARGVFGAEMEVELVNDGPMTIWLDSAVR